MDKVYRGLEKHLTRQDAHYFFGYFDKFPWNRRGEHLAHRVAFAGRQPRYGEIAEVGILRNGIFDKIGETTAWCWQQGSMLQWFTDDVVIYNQERDHRHVAGLTDGRVLNRPVYTLSPDRKFALSLNFSRLDRERPGYGYPGLWDDSIDYAFPDFDGITLMDLEKDTEKLIVPLSRLVNEFPAPGADTAPNWVNHLLFSPDGKRISFLHRWRGFGPWGRGYRSYVTRMFTANRDGSDLWMLPIDFHASHYTWSAPDRLIVFSRLPEGGDQYRIYTVGDDHPKILAKDRLPPDGHCSFSPDGRLLLTDSYTDKNGCRELVIYSPEKDERYSMGYYQSPDILPPTRCDLHPRWSPDGRKISFDSFHEKYRGIYEIELPEEILK